MSNRLLSISPIDGRYHKNVKVVSNYFSEYALIKYRIFVEISYYITLIKTLKEKNEKLPIPINNGVHSMIDVFNIITSFNIDNAISIKEIEKVTLHDVKAVEYFITKLEFRLASIFCVIQPGNKIIFHMRRKTKRFICCSNNKWT
mgnify:CR=1 FL=1